MTPILLAAPWLAFFVFVRFVVRIPSELPEVEGGGAGRAPQVSIVLPARNERLNIERCVRSLAALEYPSFEIVVVDDRSEDGTGALARSVPCGNATRLVVIDGVPLPEGWLGKPWACHQGMAVACGELLLFTDADTEHAPDLLARALLGMEEDAADLLTVMGRQEMETFWERLVQPHIFILMLLRFPAFERTARNSRWRDAIANGQYLLFRRDAYEAIGGHEAVRDQIVEDLALAQHVKMAGLALRIRSAVHGLSTRMYRSLGELVAGWSKNLYMGGVQAFPRHFRPLVLPASLVGGVVLWLAPPATLVGGGGAVVVGASAVTGWLVWAAIASAASAAAFAWFAARMGAPARYGLAYPLGAIVTLWILARSYARGREVEWKGRRYTLTAFEDRP